MKPDTAQWRDPQAYAFVKGAAANVIAWEFLRRNSQYQQDFAVSRSAKAMRALRKRWGLQFRSQARPVRGRADRLLGASDRSWGRESCPDSDSSASA